ncbi:Non-specific serine/threonine protein kinase [Bertholletia excelsa]
MANRDTPVNGKGSKLSLLSTGNLVLTDWDGSIVWSTNTLSESPLEAQLLETGNLVLMTEKDNVTIWESFGFPTDTLLPDQPITKNTSLVSMRSRDTYLSGYYNFKFDDNNVLQLTYNGPFTSSVYWPNTIDGTVFEFGRTPYNSSRAGFLSHEGRFRASDNLKFNSSNYGIGPKRRLTLDYDGVLRVYSLDESTGLWEVNWLPGGVDACNVHGLCGPFGVCSYNPFPTCSCPYGFYRNDPSDWFKGCSPLFNLTCNQTDDDIGFISLPKTDYFGYDLNTYSTGVSFETCKNACLTDCKCQGFAYSQEGDGQCFPKRTLLDGSKMPDCTRVTHIKVPKWVVASQSKQKEERSNDLNCSAAKLVLADKAVGGGGDAGSSGYLRYLIAFVGSFAIIELVCIGLGWWFVFRRHVREELANMGYAVLALGFKRFSFAELKRATQNFKEEIGKGGFGTVYRGVLDNHRAVAVKRLDGVLQGESEFWAEVSIIGKLNHRNLVKMWGFCAEGKHKLLVYDYMENGSLDKILFSESNLGWEARYNIALGTAKGLAYIHEECLEWMIHCDVKPQNILLDEHLEPRVTDFGMSKLFKDNLDGVFLGLGELEGT